MIQQYARHLSPLMLVTLCVASLLVGCGPSSGPAQTEQPTRAPSSVPATSAAPTVQPATSAPTSLPATPTAPAAQLPTSAPASPAQPATPAATAAPETAAGDQVAAIQVVLDYYDAINQQAYDRAYRLWAQNGAASGQTSEQFKQGFDGTVQVSVQIGKTSAQSGAVTVPVAIASVVNVTNQEQRVRRFGGTYSVEKSADGWRLAGAKIADLGDAQPPADLSDPLAVLQAYYAAINAREFGRAYTYWSNNGAASQQTFTQFSQGFADTTSVTIATSTPQIGAAAGSAYAETPIAIVATQADGSQQTFCGTYTLRRVNVPPFDQLGWRIDRASIAQVANAQPGGDAAQRLLASGCKP